MKKQNKPLLLICISLTFVASMAFLAKPGFAQDDQPDLPVYIVQPGDTLYVIALRFGVTLQDLIDANEQGDPNRLQVGDQLRIPGLEGAAGVLTTERISFGENIWSISKRYRISLQALAKLNRLVSPKELVQGASLILPVSEETMPQFERVIIPAEKTLLEIAILNGTSPWQMVNFNGIANTQAVVPGGVYMVPGTVSEGPGGFPTAITGIETSEFVQGETGVIRVKATEQVQFEGALGDYPLGFFAYDDEEYAALQGVHALKEPGMYPLTISGSLQDGTDFAFSQYVYIDGKDYIFEYINVPPALIDPETTEKEGKVVREMVEPMTEKIYWKDLFQAPSPFADCINSTFGNRRSYNGSAFSYYHGGTDFCGGGGVEIFASARGKVVFAGPLEIRGNYTLIDHGRGVYSGYMHQSEVFVETGDVVKPGEVIGLVGNTGRSTGAHLHWEIWVGGVLVNPVNWLEKEFP